MQHQTAHDGSSCGGRPASRRRRRTGDVGRAAASAAGREASVAQSRAAPCLFFRLHRRVGWEVRNIKPLIQFSNVYMLLCPLPSPLLIPSMPPHTRYTRHTRPVEYDVARQRPVPRGRGAMCGSVATARYGRLRPFTCSSPRDSRGCVAVARSNRLLLLGGTEQNRFSVQTKNTGGAGH